MRLSLLGPVFWYELIASSRRLRYFFVRGAYLSILLFLLWRQYQVSESRWKYDSSSRRANFAAEFFEVFAVAQMATVVLLTPALLASTIAQERERKTIEYLFASELTNVEIVFGKVAAKLLQTTMLVAAGLPVLAMVMMMGGIEPEGLALVFLATLSSMLLVAGLSIGISTVSPSPRDSLIRVYLILLALFALPPLARVFLSGFHLYSLVEQLDEPLAWLSQINPFVIVESLLAVPTRRTGPTALQTAGPAMVWQTVMGLGSMSLAAAVVRRYHRWQAGKGARIRRRLGRRRPALDASRVAKYPMLWKEMHQEGGLRLGFAGRLALWLVLLAMGGVEAWQICQTWLYGDRPVRPWFGGVEMLVDVNATVGGVAAGLALLGILVRAATSITSEKDRDCWLTLISSPIDGEAIVMGKFWGALYSVRALVLFATVSMAIPVFFAPTFLGAFFLWCATVAILAAFMAAAGIQISMRARSSLQATVAAGVMVLLLGGGYLVCCTPCLIQTDGNSQVSMQFMLAPCIPFLGAAPAMAWVESNHLGDFFGGYILGTIGYGVLALGLLGACRSGFDALAGRAPSRAGGPAATNAAKPETAPAKPPAAPAAPAPSPGEEPPP